MNDRLETALQVALVLLVVAFIAGQAIGQPVVVSYVETGSMEPTIGEGDGFLVVPAVVAGPPESGDVVVFQAETLHNGSVTTHRVVEANGDGYVTRGDANTFTDQEGAEPPVTDDRILGTAVAVNGEVVVVPGLGRAIEGAEALVSNSVDSIPLVSRVSTASGTSWLAFLGVGLTLVGAGLLMGYGTERSREATRSTRRHESFRTRWLGVALAAVIVVVATAAMLLASGPVQYGLVALDEGAADDDLAFEAGSVGAVTHELPNNGFAPVVVIREAPSEDVHVVSRSTVIGPRSSAETSLRVHVPGSRGRFDRTVTERRYVAVLPPSLLVALDSIHPWLAIVAVDTVLALAVLLAAAVAWPGTYVRVRPSTGPSPWRRLRRLFGQQS